MWIKWKYNDHGCSGFKEVEIPDDFDGYESVEEYICEMGWVSTWSERFIIGRIMWEPLNLSKTELKDRKTRKLHDRIISLSAELKACKIELQKTYYE